MKYSAEVEHMCPLTKGAYHGPAPIPQEGKWTQAKEIKDISGLTHGVGWCAPQQGTCKLTLNVKEGIIQEALVETVGCSGMTHSAAMASEILVGKTILEVLIQTLSVCISYSYERAFLRLFTVVHKQLFQRTVFQSVLVLRTLVKDLDHRLVQLMQHLKRAQDTLNLQKVT